MTDYNSITIDADEDVITEFDSYINYLNSTRYLVILHHNLTDIEYLQNKLFTAIKVPKTYLNYNYD